MGSFLLCRLRPPLIATVFPYTTLFRSVLARDRDQQVVGADGLVPECDRFAEREFERTLRRRSEEHTSELQSHSDLVCRLLLEKKKSDVLHASVNELVVGMKRVNNSN